MMIRDHRCALCSLIAVFSDVCRDSCGGPWKLVGNILKSLGASDRLHGCCWSVLGGFRELHKVVLEVLGELVDVLTSSMTSQGGRKTTKHSILQCLEASTAPKVEFWRPRSHDPRDCRHF